MAERFDWPQFRRRGEPAAGELVAADSARAMPARFEWPYARRPGIRYGNLSEHELAMLAPHIQERLPDRAMTERVQDQITEAGVPELLMADPVLAPPPSSSPRPPSAQLPLLYARFSNVQLSIGLGSGLQLVQPSGGARRVYLFVVNTHPTQIMYLNFQVAATVLLGIPILNNYGFVEYNQVVPQDDVHMIADGAATTGVLVFANKSPAEAEA